MLDRHAVQELLRAGLTLGAVARQLGVSRRTIRRIKREPAGHGGDSGPPGGPAARL